MTAYLMSVRTLLWALVGLSFFTACTKKRESTLYTNCKLTANTSTQVSIGGFPRNPNRMSSTGTVNVTIVMVDFPDAVASKTPAEAYAMISGATATFNEQSYGRLTYTMTPQLQWFRMSKNSTEYRYDSFENHRAYIQEAVELADSSVNFANTDLIVVLGNPDAVHGFDIGPTLLAPAGYGVTADGNEMLNAITSGYDLNTWGSIWLNHESTHALGLVDLYASVPVSNTLFGVIPYTGGFSYMGLNSFDSTAPGLTAWERWVLGWLDDSQVLCSNPRIDGEINTTLTPIESSGGQKAVIVPISSTKVVVVESRRASGIDAHLVKAGALVYTVDSSIASGSGPIEVFPKGSESDPYFAQSTRAKGESVTTNGLTVEVIESDSTGDQVRISANKFQIDR